MEVFEYLVSLINAIFVERCKEVTLPKGLYLVVPLDIPNYVQFILSVNLKIAKFTNKISFVFVQGSEDLNILDRGEV